MNAAITVAGWTIVQEGTGADLLKSDTIRKAYLGM